MGVRLLEYGHMLITSKQNPKIKELIALRGRRERQAAGVMLIDGFDEISLALSAGIQMKALYFCPGLMGDGQQSVTLDHLLHSDLEAHELSREVFEKVSYREGPDGWLAVAPLLDADLAQLKLPEKALILICESVEKPGNLGAMLRTADAAGVSAVITVDAKTDWGNPNVIRASKGTVFAVPVADATQAELAGWLADNGFKLAAATPASDQLYTKTDFTGRLAVMVGAENEGLSDFWLGRADVRVVIPMVGKVDSLNVATAAAVLLYEAVRQRGGV